MNYPQCCRYYRKWAHSKRLTFHIQRYPGINLKLAFKGQSIYSRTGQLCRWKRTYVWSSGDRLWSFWIPVAEKHDSIVHTTLKMIKLPINEPKTLERFDSSWSHGKHLQSLKNFSSLSALYARKIWNLLDHRVQAPSGYGFWPGMLPERIQDLFLKANELNQKLTNARKHGWEDAVISWLVKPSCLIIDEICSCLFDNENRSSEVSRYTSKLENWFPT